MATRSQDAYPPLCRVLGLSVAAGYTSLGSYAAFAPVSSAKVFGLRAPESTPATEERMSAALAWIGARDISIAVALLALDYQRNPKAMGTLILSSMILCLTDSYFIVKARRDWVGWSVLLGAGYWGWVGWRLYQL